MNKQEIYTKLDEIFQDVFDDDSIHVTEDTTADDVEDWDSLMHITLISTIEEEFNVHFSMGEVSTMKNVGEMVDLIMARC